MMKGDGEFCRGGSLTLKVGNLGHVFGLARLAIRCRGARQVEQPKQFSRGPGRRVFVVVGKCAASTSIMSISFSMKDAYTTVKALNVRAISSGFTLAALIWSDNQYRRSLILFEVSSRSNFVLARILAIVCVPPHCPCPPPLAPAPHSYPRKYEILKHQTCTSNVSNPARKIHPRK